MLSTSCAPPENYNGDSDRESSSEGDGWMEFGEVVGDESEMYARITPSNPKPETSAKVEVKIGSAYGRPKPALWVRLGSAPETGQIQDPDKGEEWTELLIVGGQLWDHQLEKMVPMSETKETPMDEQPGESHYEVELTVPPDSNSVEFKIQDEFDGKVMAFRAWTLPKN